MINNNAVTRDSSIKIGSIQFQLGEEIVELEDNCVLKDDRRSQMFLRTMGFGQYKRSDRTLGELSEDAIKKTLKESGLSTDSIDLVIYASSTFGDRHGDIIDKDFATCMINCGLSHTYPIGIYRSQCNNFFTALDVAVSMLKSSSKKNILLVLADRVLGEDTRFKNLAINSDGAVACIVSSDESYSGDFTLMGYNNKTILTNKDMIDPETKEFDQEIHRNYLSGIKDVCKAAEDDSGIPIQDCGQLICHNFSFSALKQISNAIDYDYDKVFKKNIAEFGHAYASDSLINLETYRKLSESEYSDDSQYVSIIGTGLYFWGMAILKVNKNASNKKR